MPHRRRHRLPLLLPLAALLVGCAAATPAGPPVPRTAFTPAPQAPPSLARVPVLDSANDQPLPLDRYLLDPDQAAAVTSAQQELIARCMKDFGLPFTPVGRPPAQRDSDAPKSRTDGRYGHQSATLMARWGYHPEGGSHPQTDRWASPGEPGDSNARTVETGSADPGRKFGPGGQEVNGRKVPDHGCIGASNKALTGSVEGWVGDPPVSTEIKLDTLRRSQEDPRTREVFAKWSACMKDSGFSYPDPVAALSDPRWQETQLPAPQEILTATADAKCRKEHNVVGVWYAVDFAYQSQEIAANAPALAEAEAGVKTQVSAAKQVLGGR